MVIKKSIILKRKRFWAGFLLAQFVLFYLFSKIPIVIRFFEGFFDVQKTIHQRLFSWIPFSVGDVFYMVLIFFLSYLIVKIFSKKRRSKAVLQLLICLNVMYFSYQIFWGMLYFQKPLIEKLPQQEPTLEEAKTLALQYLEKCKQTRSLVKEDENVVFTLTNKSAVEKSILKNQRKIPVFISDKKTSNIHSFKSSLFGEIMSYTGILGYYNPFSAEAQINPHLPASYIPFTLSHESAHQIGFAREQEANFIGYLIGKEAENLDLKYSTEYFVLKSLLNAIIDHDEYFVEQVLENYSEPLKRDRLFEKEFAFQHRGFLDAFFGVANNWFLKSNQQDGSITYSYFVDLLIRYERL